MSLTIDSSLLPLADTHALYHLARAWGVPKLPHASYNRLVAQLGNGDYSPDLWFYLGLRVYCATLAHVANSFWSVDYFHAELLATSVVLRPSGLRSGSPSLTYRNLRDQLASAADPLLASLSTRLLALADSLDYNQSWYFPFAPHLSRALRFRSSKPRAGVSGLMVLPYGHQASPYGGLSSTLRLWPVACSSHSAITFSQAVTLTAFCLLAVEYMSIYRTLLDLLPGAPVDRTTAQDFPSLSPLPAPSFGVSFSANSPFTFDTSSSVAPALPADVYQRFLARLAAWSSNVD